MIKTTLIIFTEKFPYGVSSENAFLQPEIPYLVKKFNNVYVVPRIIDGKTNFSSEQISVDDSLSEQIHHRKRGLRLLTAALLSKFFRNEFRMLARKRSRFFQRLKAAIWVFGYAIAVSEWVEGFISAHQIDINNTVFYTYWFSKVNSGLALAKQNNADIKIISRAHNVDLYPERQKSKYFPFREQSLEQLNKLILISENGLETISANYPEYREKYNVSKLGTIDANAISQSSKDGICRIVSCSYITEVKRVDLLVAGLEQLAKSQLDHQFRWDHFGDGPMQDEILELVKILPDNIETKLWGLVPNHQILDHYQINPVDVFINVSSFEGIPVSIMEAQSCGIPVIATAVGGTPEIVSPENGILLSANPSPEKIRDAVWELYSSKVTMKSMRTASLENWHRQHSAEPNYAQFANDLSDLLVRK